MAEITLQKVGASGLANVVLGQAAAGDTAQVGDNKKLIVQNTDASSHTVTLAVPGTGFTGIANPDLAVPVAAGQLAIIPLLDIYADATQNGRAVITYDATPATLKRAVVAF
jgi:hypothetical protein